ncbi:MAG TPA: tetratricopeptide repeat protein, partial [Niastella sp.]|nr:tetratricopeptide repeat protein [Niastella sp.]
RPNVDNWQRLAAIKQSSATVSANIDEAEGGGKIATAGPMTFEELLKSIPLTPAQMATSNDSIEKAQFNLGKAYLEELEDYTSTINTLEAFLVRFPESKHRPEALFLLAYCYSKTGDAGKAAGVQSELKQKYAGTNFEKIVSNPNGISPDSTAKKDMTRRYDNIYNLYIEGNFDEAQTQKKIADSMYNKNYWTPQLLYIQSVYYIKQRQDDSAKKTLTDITRLFPNSPMAAKARALIDVLSRRKQIEDYLTNLQIERPAEDSTAEPVTIVTPQPAQQQPVVQPQPVKEEPPVVVKPDPKPATNMPKTQQPTTTVPKVEQPKPDVAKIDKPVTTPVKPPVTQLPPPPVKKDSVSMPKVKEEEPKPLVLTHNAEQAHYVAIVLDKVDPVYVNEARNAFTRYNREQYSAKGLSVNNHNVSDAYKLVLIGTFPNAGEAITYIDKTKKLAATEIVPWLPAAKYSFIIVTDNNLQVLMNTKDVNTFKQFLNQQYPGKF